MIYFPISGQTSCLLGCGSSIQMTAFSNSTQKSDIGVGVGLVKKFLILICGLVFQQILLNFLLFFLFLDKPWAYTSINYFLNIFYAPNITKLGSFNFGWIFSSQYENLHDLTQICRPEDLRPGPLSICLFWVARMKQP